jgi:hypothetical protein
VSSVAVWSVARRCASAAWSVAARSLAVWSVAACPLLTELGGGVLTGRPGGAVG